MSDLFSEGSAARKRPAAAKSPPIGSDYGARDIEVLEGLEPVRKRPGMYIGGTDERALHHLVAEILDNAMDEAVAGHATRIDLELSADQHVTVRDNGRGIPIDEHPKFPGKSALEVILTTLHSGGKFGGTAYATSGGLHGVGISVVNALSDSLVVEVARDRSLWRQAFSRGQPLGGLEPVGPVHNRRGTTVTFHPDPEIFGPHPSFRSERLYRLARSKAYLYRGVEIRWRCDETLIRAEAPVSSDETFHFPNGLTDYLAATLDGRERVFPTMFCGEAAFAEDAGRVEWAIAWPKDGHGLSSTYCNTIPTPQGGTHESGLRTALVRALKGFGEMVGNRKAAQITADDLVGDAAVMLSVFIREPQFQGQTKDRLASPQAARLVDGAMKDAFDHWLAGDAATARALLEHCIERAEERVRKRADKDMARKTATRRLRLPGKLTDCARSAAEGTEIFLVEGDSAGGTAKQARNRETQAVLPLRGKILNVASAGADKLRANQEVQDLALALGCGLGKECDPAKLRYERVIIMTDADVDGAHIGALLMTFFFRLMRPIVEDGSLFLAMPPLYRIQQGARHAYARDDAHRDALLEGEFAGGRGKVEISRFKGLGEMPFAQLRETTMNPASRSLMRVSLHDVGDVEAAPPPDGGPDSLVERLMGRNAETRFRFIQENAQFARDLDI